MFWIESRQRGRMEFVETVNLAAGPKRAAREADGPDATPLVFGAF
jgi:hypothetical protein